MEPPISHHLSTHALTRPTGHAAPRSRPRATLPRPPERMVLTRRSGDPVIRRSGDSGPAPGPPAGRGRGATGSARTAAVPYGGPGAPGRPAIRAASAGRPADRVGAPSTAPRTPAPPRPPPGPGRDRPRGARPGTGGPGRAAPGRRRAPGGPRRSASAGTRRGCPGGPGHGRPRPPPGRGGHGTPRVPLPHRRHPRRVGSCSPCSDPHPPRPQLSTIAALFGRERCHVWSPHGRAGSLAASHRMDARPGGTR